MDNHDSIAKQTDEVSEWKEERQSSPQTVTALPSSSDKAFWGEDAVIRQRKVEDIELERQAILQQMSNHKLQMIGQDIVCSSCPHSHTISLFNTNLTLNRDGKLVSIDNNG